MNDLEHKLEHLLTRLEIMKVRHMLEASQIHGENWGVQLVEHHFEERKKLVDEITQIKMELKHDS